MTDTYKTILSNSKGIFKDKGSKFFAFAFPIENVDQVKPIIQQLKKEHHSARHHCYAYKLGINNEQVRLNDDGEPSGTAGRPIFGQIESSQLTNILIVVVRYFGGILLGTSGLINAYKNAAKNSLENTSIITKEIKREFSISFNYDYLNIAMRIAKEEHLDIIEQDFREQCKMVLATKVSKYELAKNKYSNIHGIDII